MLTTLFPSAMFNKLVAPEFYNVYKMFALDYNLWNSHCNVYYYKMYDCRMVVYV